MSIVDRSITCAQVQLLEPTGELLLGHPPGILLYVLGDIFLQRIWNLLDLVVPEQPLIATSTPKSRGVSSTGLCAEVRPIETH